MPRFSMYADCAARPEIRPVPDDSAQPGELYLVRGRRGDHRLVMCRLKSDGRTRQLGPLPRGFVRATTIDHVPLGFTISAAESTPLPCTRAEEAISYLRRHPRGQEFVLDFRSASPAVDSRHSSRV